MNTIPIIVFLRSVHLERVAYNHEFSVARRSLPYILSSAQPISACDFKLNNIKVLYQSVDTEEYNLVLNFRLQFKVCVI